MQKIVKRIFSTPAIHLNALVVIEVVMLLGVSLGVLFFFTRKALVEEQKNDAEERLETTVQHVDNILLTIEQTTGNFYYRLLEHLDEPDTLAHYCRKLVECNEDIVGCAIAMEPGYYEEGKPWMTYVHRKKYNSPELIVSRESDNIPYMQQTWYSETMATESPAWIPPEHNRAYRAEPIIAFSLPIRDKIGECVGVIGVGLSISLLSQIVLEAKPSPNSYSILLAKDGSYIIHPNHELLAGQKVFDQPEVAASPSAMEAAKAMLKGEEGNMSFLMNDFRWYLFYKPFVRNSVRGRKMAGMNWSIATIYPKEDIFGEYNHLVFHVMGIVGIALLVFYILCRKAIRGQMKPLAYLTESAERIGEGHYDETIPKTKRDDEVGTFQQHFALMQKALAADIAKQDAQRETLRERHEELEKKLKEIEAADEVKRTLLHNVTNRMIGPAKAVGDSVTRLCDHYDDITPEEANREIDNIKQQSETILELLSHKFEGKE